MKKTVLWLLMFSLVIVNSAFGQQSGRKKVSTKFRTIFTLGGAGGGFALGMAGGIAAFDDSVNSDRKVWATAIVAGVAGGIGGYFLGRTLDKRAERTAWRYVPDPLDRSLRSLNCPGETRQPHFPAITNPAIKRIPPQTHEDRMTFDEDKPAAGRRAENLQDN